MPTEPQICACGQPASTRVTKYPELANKCKRCRRRWHADGGPTQKWKQPATRKARYAEKHRES